MARRARITRFKLPHPGAVNFVITRALRGGVTRSRALDAHDKPLSSLLLSLEV
jgi:Flp pilus assembly protein TadB